MPVGFINLGFETGASPNGHMAGWTSVFFSSTFQFVGFGDALETVSWEDFENEWGSNEDGIFEFEPGDTVVAIYDLIPQNYEDFESEWAGGNQVHYTIMPGTVLAAYTAPGPDYDYEPFETGWSNNEDDVTEFGLGQTSLASYDAVPEDLEDFEEEWDSNEDDITEFGPGDTAEAIYDQGGPDQLFEDFEEVDLVLARIEVTAVGADGDAYRININNGTVEFVSAGVGPESAIRDIIVDAFNAQMVGIAEAAADGGAVMTIRAAANGTPLDISIEVTGLAMMILSYPDRSSNWTQLHQL